MRSIIAILCLCTVACSGQSLTSPTSPTSAARTNGLTQASSGGQTQAQGASVLPFQGTFTMETMGTVTPPTLVVNGTATGTASHVGRFTAVSVDVVNLPTATSTGTFNLTAANGDQIFMRTSGGEEGFTPPNISRVRLGATVVGGTGRFEAASGTLTILETLVIDYATGMSSASGTIEGHISLGH